MNGIENVYPHFEPRLYWKLEFVSASVYWFGNKVFICFP